MSWSGKAAADMSPAEFASLSGRDLSSIASDLARGALASVRRPSGDLWVAASAVQALFTERDAEYAVSVPGSVLTNSTRKHVSPDTYARITGRSVDSVNSDVARGALQSVMVAGTLMVKGGEVDVFYYRRSQAGYTTPGGDPDSQSPVQ